MWYFYSRTKPLSGAFVPYTVFVILSVDKNATPIHVPYGPLCITDDIKLVVDTVRDVKFIDNPNPGRIFVYFTELNKVYLVSDLVANPEHLMCMVRRFGDEWRVFYNSVSFRYSARKSGGLGKEVEGLHAKNTFLFD